MAASVSTADRLQIIALVGNPNAGKTSLFNALTGSSQKVGNYPGVTVERVSGTRRVDDALSLEFIDIPGLYSLNPVSVDEQVAVDALRGVGDALPDLLVIVVDANQLERGLFFFSQVVDLGLPMVVAITMTDILEKHGQRLEIEALAEMLETRVVVVTPHKGIGIDALVRTTCEQLQVRSITPPVGRAPGSDVVLSTDERYKWAAEVRSAVTTVPAKPKRSTTSKIDSILTHRVFGFGVFLVLMYAMFQSIYTLAAPIMDGIEWAFGQLGASVGSRIGVDWFRSLIVDGLIGGIGAVAVFLPQILILFFFIAALEGTGYMARAAFLMDRMLGWCGLNGRAFIPLLSSFACAIPGIMAARVMPDSRSRLATILVAPLMSCSARLPVYVLLIGAFIEPQFGAAWAGFALFAMHFVGVIVAIPVVFFLNRKVLRGKRLPFIMELPRYQWPKWRDVWFTMWLRAKSFVQTAGTIIVVMSIGIWALLYFPRADSDAARYSTEYAAKSAEFRETVGPDAYFQSRQTESSYLGQFGKFIEPAFIPAGFDWRISTAILTAFPAREVVLSSIGILFDLGSEPEDKSLVNALERAKWPDGRPLFTPWTAAGLMVFFALCCQCMATLATVKRETNSWKWPLFIFTYMTVLAYLAAIGIHRLGLWLG